MWPFPNFATKNFNSFNQVELLGRSYEYIIFFWKVNFKSWNDGEALENYLDGIIKTILEKERSIICKLHVGYTLIIITRYFYAFNDIFPIVTSPILQSELFHPDMVGRWGSWPRSSLWTNPVENKNLVHRQFLRPGRLLTEHFPTSCAEFLYYTRLEN